jgi:hypothetical protein
MVMFMRSSLLDRCLASMSIVNPVSQTPIATKARYDVIHVLVLYQGLF